VIKTLKSVPKKKVIPGFFNEKFVGKSDIKLMRKLLHKLDHIDLGSITEVNLPRWTPLMQHFPRGGSRKGITVGKRFVSQPSLEVLSAEERVGFLGGTLKVAGSNLFPIRVINFPYSHAPLAHYLHEIGHALTNPYVLRKPFKYEAMSDLTREIAAWKWASKQMKTLHLGSKEIAEFQHVRLAGLLSYKRYHVWHPRIIGDYVLEGYGRRSKKEIKSFIASTKKSFEHYSLMIKKLHKYPEVKSMRL